MLLPSRAEDLPESFGILVRKGYVCSLPFLYSIICISVNSGALILHFNLQSNTALFYYSDCSSFGHWELFQLVLVSFGNAPMFLFFEYFLTFQQHEKFQVPILESIISPRNLVPFMKVCVYLYLVEKQLSQQEDNFNVKFLLSLVLRFLVKIVFFKVTQSSTFFYSTLVSEVMSCICNILSLFSQYTFHVRLLQFSG